MGRNVSFWMVLCVVAAPAIARAQSTGVIIQASPQQYGTPAPQQQYVVQAQPYVQAPQPTYGASVQCPPDSTLQPDRRGIARCMRLESGHRVTWGLAGAGIGMLAGGWLFEIFTTAFSSIDSRFGSRDTYVGWGYVPLVGPWVQMADLPPNTSSPMYVWLAVEGLLQDAGLIMLIAGLVGEDYEEYRPIAAGDVRVRPMLSAAAQGITLEGVF